MYPSGPWVGYYNHSPREKHRMDLNLTFTGGRMAGEGRDGVGRFVIQGRYDTAERECWWTKTYVGAHDVFYRGYREGKGIWGIWEISAFSHGGFHIWPRPAGEGETAATSAAEQKPAEAAVAEPLALPRR
jgi:hypothetical protein